jgi:hypothetical protein
MLSPYVTTLQNVVIPLQPSVGFPRESSWLPYVVAELRACHDSPSIIWTILSFIIIDLSVAMLIWPPDMEGSCEYVE